ncbi:unnamed protein product [Polarella glacialis]|uniref:Rab-GAP TBC domain-containing protein n=1 Tax=Polarella glacialis TaxID=89957 RepID=A0A813EX41_POLGL|nr:unnamed protein product [Polarella glacialis]
MAPHSTKGRRRPQHAQGRTSQTPEQEQVRAVQAALAARDFAALQELAFSRFGFCSCELRRAVWQFLLGVNPEKGIDSSWRKLLADVDQDVLDGKEARVMQADVQRSVYTWDVHSGIRKSARSQKREQLLDVMLAILRQHPGKLSYFQGFHDIALVFLEVGTPSQAFHMVERLALFHLSDQLCCPFDKGLIPLLGLLFCLLERVDAAVATALREADCAELHFAVPWVLTWFAHSLPRLHEQVMRLFDCLLASHPAMLLYFAAALLLHHRDTILTTEREMPEMVSALQKLPLGSLDADEWASKARQLAKQVPPEELLRRLPPAVRLALPSTSPLFHFPHPWMVSAGKASAEKDLSALAPIYRGGSSGLAVRRSYGGALLDNRSWGLLLVGGLFSSGFGLALRTLCLPGTLTGSLWRWLGPRKAKK